MKVLDSTFIIDLLRGKLEAKNIFKSNTVLLTTQINLYEVLSGLFARNVSSAKFLSAQELFEHIRVLPLNDYGIIKSAEINGDLIKKGEMIEDTDCLTAGIALSHNVETIITKKQEKSIKD